MMATEFGKRVKAARKHRKLAQHQLARAVGVSQGTVSEMETEFHSSSYTAQIAEVCGVSAHWLATGEGEMLPSITTAQIRMTGIDPSPPPDVLPLITWERASTWDRSRYHDPEATEYLPCPAPHGEHAYCLRVGGDSMHNPAGRPSYDDGDVIFVDPDIAPQAGNRVIVCRAGQPAASFKQLVVEDGRQLLKALNPEWHPRYLEITDQARIVGVVIGKWVPE